MSVEKNEIRERIEEVIEMLKVSNTFSMAYVGLLMELLDNDTLILSKEELKKYIKVKELNYEAMPSYCVTLSDIEEWKKENNSVFITSKGKTVETQIGTREITLDLKVIQKYERFIGDKKDIEEIAPKVNQIDPVDYFFRCLEMKGGKK